MDVKIDERVNEKQIKVCDLIVIKDNYFRNNIHIVLEESQGFILRSFKSGQGATGYFSTIPKLIQSIDKYGYTHYSQDEYQLVLERKS